MAIWVRSNEVMKSEDNLCYFMLNIWGQENGLNLSHYMYRKNYYFKESIIGIIISKIKGDIALVEVADFFSRGDASEKVKLDWRERIIHAYNVHFILEAIIYFINIIIYA